MKRTVVVLIIGFVIAAVLGCAAEEEAGGTFRMGVDRDSTGYDPVRSSFSRTGSPIYDSLLYMDPISLEVGPALATSWDVSADGLTITLKLRQGVKFHDGTDFKANAVKTLERAVNDPKTVQKPYLYAIKGVEIIDDYTAAIRLNAPNSPLLSQLAGFTSAIPSPTAVEKWGDDYGLHPVGTGPFEFVEWIPDSHLKTKRNPNYWKEGLPYLDEVILQPIPDSTVRMVALRGGSLDAAVPLASADIEKAKADPNIKVLVEGSIAHEGWLINSNKPPLDKKACRQAVAYSVDKKAMVEGVYLGYGSVAEGILPPDHWAHSPNVKGYPFDLAKAKEKLTECGGSLEFTIQTWKQPERQQTAEALQAQLAKAGIKANIQVQDFVAMLTLWDTGDYNASSAYWGAWIDLDQPYSYIRPPRYSPYLNDAVNGPNGLLFTQGQAYDQEERAKILQLAEQTILDDVGWIIFGHPANTGAISNKVRNFVLSKYAYWPFEEVWLEK